LNNELRLHQEVTEAMLSDSKLDQVLTAILSGITRENGLGFDRAILFLADENGRELRVAAVQGPPDQTALLEKLKSFVVPASASAPPLNEGDDNVPVQALVAHCAGFNKSFTSNSIRAIYQPPAGSGGEVLQFCCVASIPLRFKDSILGVLLVDNTFSERPVQESELSGLVTLGNLAVAAIENSRMNQRLAEMASRDGLTGVYNRRYYQARLVREVDLAKQSGRALGLLVFHVNEFEKANDTHGFECGDRILIDLANFLRKGVRTEDLIARYGEAEFLVMLTGGASQEEAKIVADKLLSQVSSQSFGGLPAGQVVINCGIAWMPCEKLNRDSISRLADEALEQAKLKAGACIVLADN